MVDSLPKPIEDVKYLDSKNVRYLISGNEIFNFGQSNYYYQDERNKVLYYRSELNYDNEYINKISKIINGLRYTKNDIDYKNINVDNLEKVYCNDDWYVIKFKNGNVEKFINLHDSRAYSEMHEALENRAKSLQII